MTCQKKRKTRDRHHAPSSFNQPTARENFTRECLLLLLLLHITLLPVTYRKTTSMQQQPTADNTVRPHTTTGPRHPQMLAKRLLISQSGR
jgi:hypothetical protein